MTKRERRMNAYYYSFEPTGVEAIDRLLSAVACAGKAYHHTNGWTETVFGGEPYEPDHRGGTPVEWIQNAAEDAAAEFRSMPAPAPAASPTPRATTSLTFDPGPVHPFAPILPITEPITKPNPGDIWIPAASPTPTVICGAGGPAGATCGKAPNHGRTDHYGWAVEDAEYIYWPVEPPGASPTGAARCACGHTEEQHRPTALDRLSAPMLNLDPRCRERGCGCDRFRQRAPRPSPTGGARPCNLCGGKGGRVRLTCSLCGDSTYDHYCNDGEWIPCPKCTPPAPPAATTEKEPSDG